METSSLAFPAMFDVVQNKVAVLEDEISVANRSKLLFLTEPTELYNEPDQGVGLKKYLWTYNNENTKALIEDNMVRQLRLHEPKCVPENTTFSDGNLFTGSMAEEYSQKYNRLEMTVSIETTFGAEVSFYYETQQSFYNRVGREVGYLNE